MPPDETKLLISSGVLTVVLSATVLLGIDTVHTSELFFWRLHWTSLVPGVLVATALGVAALLIAADRLRQRPWAPVLLLLAAFCAQTGLAFAEGRGARALAERALFSGHSEFVRVAASGVPAELVASRYEELAARPDQRYTPSKPPGQLLLYIGLERLSGAAPRIDEPVPDEVGPRHRQLVWTLAWALPLLAACVVWPLAALGRRLLPARQGLWPASLMAITASFTLITLHMDQAVYPTLACALWWCAVRAGEGERALAWGAAGGGVAWLATGVSFSLLPAVALTPLLVAAGAPEGERLRRAALATAALAGAFLVLTAGAAWLWGYDPLLRFKAAMAHHAAWRQWDPAPTRVARSTLNSLLDFFWWSGPAATALFLAAVGGAGRRLARGAREPLDLLSVVLALLLVALPISGRLIAETGRLWLFLLPLVLLIGARALSDAPRSLAIVAALQGLWTVALKLGQDFD